MKVLKIISDIFLYPLVFIVIAVLASDVGWHYGLITGGALAISFVLGYFKAIKDIYSNHDSED